jgi:hypothetical protein
MTQIIDVAHHAPDRVVANRFRITTDATRCHAAKRIILVNDGSIRKGGDFQTQA